MTGTLMAGWTSEAPVGSCGGHQYRIINDPAEIDSLLPKSGEKPGRPRRAMACLAVLALFVCGVVAQRGQSNTSTPTAAAAAAANEGDVHLVEKYNAVRVQHLIHQFIDDGDSHLEHFEASTSCAAAHMIYRMFCVRRAPYPFVLSADSSHLAAKP